VPDSSLADSPEDPGRRRGLWNWIDRRTGLNELLRKSLDEPIPGGARLAYVFGSGLLFIFLSQIVTGVCLTLYYVPSAETAHVSVAYIAKEVAAGSFLRSLHSYGSSAMIVVLLLHFLQTFLYGSYKGRRELLWISGTVASLLVLGMAFTGYLLPWDQKAYFATSVGTNIAGQVPIIGESIRLLLRGGAAMGTLTISRFYVLHVFAIPGLIFGIVAVHIAMFRKAGAAGPIREDPLRPSLRAELFYPKQVLLDMSFAVFLIGVLGLLAHFHPVTLGPVADPTDSRYLPRPEWYYLPMFQWLKYWEGPRSVLGIVLIPAVVLAVFVLLPFLDRSLERRPWRRPIPLAGVLIVLIGGVWLGAISRIHDARDPSVAAQLADQDREEDQAFHAPFEPYVVSSHPGAGASALGEGVSPGKIIFDSHGCNGCHGAGGGGGTTGPALTHIGDQYQASDLANLLKSPTAKMRAGGMVSVDLSATDMTALVSYIRGLGASGAALAASPGPVSGPSSIEAKAAAPGLPTPGHPTPIAAPIGGRETSSRSAGREIFVSRGCLACHGEAGSGTTRAPALAGLGGNRSAAQIAGLLRNPTVRMQAGGMAPLTVSDGELSALVAYLLSLEATGARPAQTAPPAIAPKTQAPEAGPPTTRTQPVAVNPAPTEEPSKPIEPDGKRVFDSHGCAACHGPGGVGTGLASALNEIGKKIAPAELATLLQHPTSKMRAGGMPPVSLSEPEMNALVAYIGSLGASATTPDRPRPPQVGTSPAVLAPVPNEAPPPPMSELEVKGRSLFKGRGCGSCHGEEGVGGTAAAPALASRGVRFPSELLGTLLRRPTEPMRQGGMPPLSMSDQELKALVAYLQYISVSKPAENR
jgi:ubiquinol-cytochrome c reductase cytochrome b subunit